jgi:hypothetical protein
LTRVKQTFKTGVHAQAVIARHEAAASDGGERAVCRTRLRRRQDARRGAAGRGQPGSQQLPLRIGSVAKPWNIADPSITLAALFGTTLAPIAGRFGWQWGIVAGFVHSSAALTVGFLHAGLNLYNNGFAAGIVASVLAPLIIAVTSARAAGGEPAAARDED